MWSPALPAVTASVNFSPPVSEGLRDARIWPGRALRRRGRALQAVQVSMGNLARKQGLYGAPCLLDMDLMEPSLQATVFTRK